ncbi:MAG: hypothetical protein O9284_05140 [Steroidobacteraceae bacterium]|jgi:nitrogen regulatory protein PII|nr:hypothetical protein [Steroidobacteraceae bacterium]
MATHLRRLVTVVTEANLERSLVDDLEQLGARGWTITDARGRGARGRRTSGWEQDGNIRIEVVCDPELADKLVQHLRARYYDHYAMIVFLHDVEVLRPDKF